MDRTVYYNADTCSTVSSSEDSYQNSPVHGLSPRSSSVTFNRVVLQDNGKVTLQDSSKKDLGHAVNDKLLDLNQKNSFITVQQQQPNNTKSSSSFLLKGSLSAHDKLLQDRPLTKKLLHTGISRVALPNARDREDVEFHYGSVLVLHLQCKNINVMTPSCLDPFYSLKNLYLYKNSIRRIQGLDSLANLELLDLSRNYIERIDNLDKCRKLKKLYLGFNEIQVVEGIENLVDLDELLLDDQDIPPEQPLIFIPGIMESVRNSLVQLDISSNQLPTLSPLSYLPMLRCLLASNNLIKDLDETVNILETLKELRSLNLKGNPIASKPVYKSKVIGAVYKLASLDGKDISDSTRSCVQKLRLMKESRARQKNESMLLNQCQARNMPPKNCPYKLDPNYTGDFNFSTPTRFSPIPPAPETPVIIPRSSQSPRTQQPSQFPPLLVDQSVYNAQARSTTDYSVDSFNPLVLPPPSSAQMSDMAKIIFRLSHLDNTKEMEGSGDAPVPRSPAQLLRAPSYWDQPGSSMIVPECRALSPLEESSNDDDQLSASMRHKFIRPKPASPAGRSTKSNTDSNSSTYVYGRTLSPLIEMPTPESLTARDTQ